MLATCHLLVVLSCHIFTGSRQVTRSCQVIRSLGHVTELPHVGGRGKVCPPRGQPGPEAVVGAEDGGALGGGHPRVEDPAALAALARRGHSFH